MAVNGEISSWAEVLSGVPQGSVLGPLLFVVYINDLPEEISTMVRMFADDTKIFVDVSNEVNRDALQDDIMRLSKWAKKWQLSFNVKKCKVMHIGVKNPNHEYTMEHDGKDRVLEITQVERDLGVHVDHKLKFSTHTEIQTNKANKILGLIRRSFTQLEAKSMCMLYKSLIRPLLEYGHSITYPRYEKDKKLIEGVQRRATKMITELKDKDYPDRLKELKLPTMHFRRDRGDVIECYKFTHGLYDSEVPFRMDNDTTRRGHSLKIKKVRADKEVRRHFFGNRVVNLWNSLPEKLVTAPSVNSFKNRLDKLWNEHLYNLEPIPICRIHYFEESEDEEVVETDVQANGLPDVV